MAGGGAPGIGPGPPGIGAPMAPSGGGPTGIGAALMPPGGCICGLPGCCPEPTYETVLQATSPETCCTVAVPVCLPACGDGCPCEKSRCTLLGCGQVRFDYACGYSVIVRFQKGGDILVTYVGF